MTALQTTALDAFRAALTDDARTQLRITRAIEYHLGTAIEQQGWTPEQLAVEANRDLATAGNVGAVITERLRVAATIAPPKAGLSQKRVHNGCCENGWIYDDTDGSVIKCLGPSKEESA